MRSDENDSTESENSQLGRDGRTSMPNGTSPVTTVGPAPAAERRSFREAEKAPSDGLLDALSSVKDVNGSDDCRITGIGQYDCSGSFLKTESAQSDCLITKPVE